MGEQPPSAGWYDDPGGSGRERWWDGGAWGGLRDDPGPALAPDPATTTRPEPLDRWLVIAGAAVVAIAAFLPWASVTAPFFGTVTVSGMEGDGVLTLLLAIGTLALAWPLATDAVPVRGRTIAAAVTAGLATLIALLAVVGVTDAARQVDDLVMSRVGIGVWVTIAAGGAALTGCVRLLTRNG